MVFWHLSSRRQGTLRTGWDCSCICQLPCAVMLAHALLNTDFSYELTHNFVLISVFCFDFGGLSLFMTLNRVRWLAKSDSTFHECSLLCWRYLGEGGFELLSDLSSSDGINAEVCGTHSPRGDQSNPPQ